MDSGETRGVWETGKNGPEGDIHDRDSGTSALLVELSPKRHRHELFYVKRKAPYGIPGGGSISIGSEGRIRGTVRNFRIVGSRERARGGRGKGPRVSNIDNAPK